MIPFHFQDVILLAQVGNVNVQEVTHMVYVALTSQRLIVKSSYLFIYLWWKLVKGCQWEGAGSDPSHLMFSMLKNRLNNHASSAISGPKRHPRMQRNIGP